MTEVSAGVILPVASSSESIVLHFKGEIEQGDAEQLEAHVSHARSLRLNVTGVSLDSVGGLVSVGASMARSIRAQQLFTTVDARAICASSCFMLFAAGRERNASDSSRIGVHSASSDIWGETDRAKSATVDIARFLAELGVPSSILGRMITAKPNEMAWLTVDELRSMRTNVASGRAVSPNSYVEIITPSIKTENVPKSVVTGDGIARARALAAQGHSSVRIQDYKAAVEYFKKARDLNGYDADIASAYGEALYFDKQNDRAREALLLSLQIRSNYAETHRILALVHAALGDERATRLSLHRYYEYVKDFDVAHSFLRECAVSQTGNGALSGAAKDVMRSINLKL